MIIKIIGLIGVLDMLALKKFNAKFLPINSPMFDVVEIRMVFNYILILIGSILLIYVGNKKIDL